jgi:hypothetical protein
MNRQQQTKNKLPLHELLYESNKQQYDYQTQGNLKIVSSQKQTAAPQPKREEETKQLHTSQLWGRVTEIRFFLVFAEIG